MKLSKRNLIKPDKIGTLGDPDESSGDFSLLRNHFESSELAKIISSFIYP